MKFFLEDGVSYIDTERGFDLSIPIGADFPKVKAWYLDDPKIEPVQAEGFVGSVEAGAAVNFRNIQFNPHAHGTHTESLGHITREVHSVNTIVHPLFYKAKVVSFFPQQINKHSGVDHVITAEQFQAIDLGNKKYDALIVRTLPNDTAKLNRDYSHSNPCYFERDVAELIVKAGIRHFLVDLPSVDREQDDGVLAFHHLFWGVHLCGRGGCRWRLPPKSSSCTF
jgi:arylformamidase